MNLVRIIAHLGFTGTLCLATVAASSAAPTRDEPKPSRAERLAELYPHGRRAADIIGMPVRGVAGEDFGRIHDLVVDTSSGDILYAIVGSGGVLGLGDNLRAVPFSALQYQSGTHGQMLVNTTIEKWRSAPPYRDDQLATLDAQAPQIYGYFDQPWKADASGSAAVKPRVLRGAKALSDCDIQVGNQKIGETEDLIVDLNTRKAAVLVDPEDRFAGGKERYVVPFSKLTPSTRDDETLITTLTADNFRGAQPLADGWSKNGEGALYIWSVDTTARVAE